MHFTTLGAAAALATVAQAFLLPPTIAIDSAGSEMANTLPVEEVTVYETDTLPYETVASVEGMNLRIPCPGCAVAFVDTEGRKIETYVDNSLDLVFEIVHGADADTFTLNGMQIWPIRPVQQSLDPLFAAQLISNGDGTWRYAAETELGYSITVQSPQYDAKQDLYLITMHLQIVQVGEAFIEGIQPIELSLVRTPYDKLMVGSTWMPDQPPKKITPSDGDQECTTALCKWKAIVAAKIASLKGCGKSNKAPLPHASLDGPKHHDSRPHRRPHGHHHGRPAFVPRVLKSILMHVILPIVIGVAVGITASLIGMLVGNIVVLVWRVLFRRTQNQDSTVHQVIIVESDDETKSFLVKEPLESPPSYTDEKV